MPHEPPQAAKEPPTVPGRRPAEDPSPDDPVIPPPPPSQPTQEPPTVPGSHPLEDPAQNPDVVIECPGPFAWLRTRFLVAAGPDGERFF